ncbi:hypothetical protein [Metaplanococcus flavidus]|uniref:Uncharacterized protein n=1 Tax=Metaplanococcus flavidus TaxID=569883 RepID=A0ABW3LFP1_9BACL
MVEIRKKTFTSLFIVMLLLGYSGAAYGQNSTLTSTQEKAIETVERLSEKYGVEVDIHVPENSNMKKQNGMTVEELENTFKFLAAVKNDEAEFTNNEMQTTNFKNEISVQNTSSGTATASSQYVLGPEINDELVNRNISFAYTVTLSDVSGGLPQWQSISQVTSFGSGLSTVDWIETSSNYDITALTIVRLTASGYWEVNEPFSGIELGVRQVDNWILQYFTNDLQ